MLLLNGLRVVALLHGSPYEACGIKHCSPFVSRCCRKDEWLAVTRYPSADMAGPGVLCSDKLGTGAAFDCFHEFQCVFFHCLAALGSIRQGPGLVRHSRLEGAALQIPDSAF